MGSRCVKGPLEQLLSYFSENQKPLRCSLFGVVLSWLSCGKLARGKTAVFLMG